MNTAKPIRNRWSKCCTPVLEMTRDVVIQNYTVRAGQKACWVDGTGQRVIFLWEETIGVDLGQFATADLDEIKGAYKKL